MVATLFWNARVWDAIRDDPYLGEVLVEGNRVKAVASGREQIDASRAACGNVTGSKGDCRKAQGHGGICEWVCRRNAEDQAAKKTAKNGAKNHAGHYSTKRELQTVRDDQAENFSVTCAERHADANLLFALGDGVRENSI